MNKRRILWADYLRCLCILLVIASHVLGTDEIWKQLLFGFNVPCLVILSGYLSAESSGSSLKQYYWKRAKRLLFPTWIFFTVYFLLIGIVSLNSLYPYSFTQIVKTYLFMDGIGYTWILAIFVMIAIFTPIYKVVFSKIRNVNLIALVLYWILGLVLFLIPGKNIIVKLMMYASGYIFLSFFGYCYESYKSKTLILLGGITEILLGLYIRFASNGNAFDFSAQKYPPTIYYVFYGLVAFIILKEVFSFLSCKTQLSQVNMLIEKISKISFDLYLWHIFALYLSRNVSNRTLRLFTVILLSFAFAILYGLIKSKISASMNHKEKK